MTLFGIKGFDRKELEEMLLPPDTPDWAFPSLSCVAPRGTRLEQSEGAGFLGRGVIWAGSADRQGKIVW